jgi:energy-coupling factor transporter ATP-binding protein EcfA2
MRLQSFEAKNVPPIKEFAADNLADIVVLAGPNGVGKTRLVDQLLSFFRNPQSGGDIRLVLQATTAAERTTWGKETLDTNVPGDSDKLRESLQANRRRNQLESAVLNFDSDRSIQRVDPVSFSFDFIDPWKEIIGWDLGFTRLRDRFKDTLNSIFRKVKSRKDEIAEKVEELFKLAGTSDAPVQVNPKDFPDPIGPFKEAFSQLLAPKTLLDPDPRDQQLYYEFEGQRFPITSLSSGEREVVNVVFDFILRNPTSCIVIFDEPELHLHPELSYKLLQTLKGIGANNQFIFCTHSPDIITASLDQSVIFIAPPKATQANQAILVREEDETHQALRLLGQSIGIVALGKKIVIIEGNHSSIDKQTYGTILKNRFPNLVMVPGGGKGVITSFGVVHREILEKSIWGVEFYMLCDRDAVPPSKDDKDLEDAAHGRLKVLKRYHIENYFLSEDVLAKVFAPMVTVGSGLTSPADIRNTLREIARGLVSYTAALTVSAYYRELVGNLDLMPKDCHGKSAGDLVGLINTKAKEEQTRIDDSIDVSKIEQYVRDAVSQLQKSLDDDTEDWKRLIPGKPVLKMFAAKAKIDLGHLKLLFLKEAENHDPHPFKDILDLFEQFNI